MRLHPKIREQLNSSARMSVIVLSVIVLALLYVLITNRFAPQYAIFSPPFVLELIGWAATVFFAVSLATTIPGWLDPVKHPAILRLVKFGEPEARMARLVEELEGPKEEHGVTFTQSFLIDDGADLAYLPTDCIMWAYVTEKKKGENSTYEVSLGLRGGEVYEFSSAPSNRENVLLCIAQRPGNHIVGYDEGLVKLWKKSHESLTSLIDVLGHEGKLPAGPHVLYAAMYEAERANAG